MSEQVSKSQEARSSHDGAQGSAARGSQGRSYSQQERPRGGRGSAQGCVQAGIGVRLSVTGDDLGGQSARPSGWGPETRPQPPCSQHGASMGLVVLEGCGLQPAWRPPGPRAQEPLA